MGRFFLDDANAKRDLTIEETANQVMSLDIGFKIRESTIDEANWLKRS